MSGCVTRRWGDGNTTSGYAALARAVGQLGPMRTLSLRATICWRSFTTATNEPDEQPREIQEQSIGTVEGGWYTTVFGEEPFIKLNEDVLFV